MFSNTYTGYFILGVFSFLHLQTPLSDFGLCFVLAVVLKFEPEASHVLNKCSLYFGAISQLLSFLSSLDLSKPSF